MKLTVFVCIFCSFFGFSQQTISASITHDGLQRDYILYVPANYTGATEVPLLFNFHGYTSDATAQMYYGDFRPIADTAGFIIVHPQGKLDNSNNTHFNVWGLTSIDDLGFTSALIDSLLLDYNIDESRVYSTGMSNGGYMSFHLACNLSDRIAAIGSVTGSIVPQTMANCNATHPTPIIQIHGTADGTVNYSGTAFASESIPNLLNYWSGFNNCDAVAIATSVPNTSTTDDCTAEKIEYLNGDNCTEVVHYKITGGGHTWPGAPVVIGVTNYDINASKEIWKFISRYDINGLRAGCSLSTSSIDDYSFQIYPNPTNSSISLKGNINQSVDYIVYSGLGEKLVEGSVDVSNNIIDLSRLQSNIYYLKIGEQTIKLIKQ